GLPRPVGGRVARRADDGVAPRADDGEMPAGGTGDVDAVAVQLADPGLLGDAAQDAVRAPRLISGAGAAVGQLGRRRETKRRPASAASPAAASASVAGSGVSGTLVTGPPSSCGGTMSGLTGTGTTQGVSPPPAACT